MEVNQYNDKSVNKFLQKIYLIAGTTRENAPNHQTLVLEVRKMLSKPGNDVGQIKEILRILEKNDVILPEQFSLGLFKSLSTIHGEYYRDYLNGNDQFQQTLAENVESAIKNKGKFSKKEKLQLLIRTCIRKSKEFLNR